MFAILAKNSKDKTALELTKKLLTLKSFTVEEYTYDSTQKLLLCYVDPSKYLPFELLKRIIIKKLSLSELEKIKKGFLNRLSKPFFSFKKGVKVKVVAGPYQEMVGVIKEVFEEEKKADVVIPVFGQPVVVRIKLEEMIPLE
ncbi:MAG: hypothetical protein QW403_01865 [Candidatus Aenigmatarchaeota archaeon]